MKPVLAFSFVALTSVSSACTRQPPPSGAATPARSTSGATAVAAPPRHAVLLHMADSHAQLETPPEYMPGETPVLQSMGGYARLRTYVLA